MSPSLPPSQPVQLPSPEAKACSHLLERLERWQTIHRPGYLRGLLPGAGAGELDALESKLGLPLPAGLRALLSWHNGQSDDFVGCFEDRWTLMSARAIAEAKHDLDTDMTGAAAMSGWQRGWVPILDDDAGDYLCLDISQASVPVRAFWFGGIDHPVLAPSLAAWLDDFVRAVEGGQYYEDPERGIFLRRREA